jgi:hypothetical protein
MFALFTAVIGFIGTLVLAIVLTSELTPYSFIEHQRASDRPAPIGWILFIVALTGGYVGYRLGS